MATPRDLARQLDALRARLDGLAAQQEARLFTYSSAPDRVDAFYGAENGMREDRVEYGENDTLAQLHGRLDAIAEEQGQERSQSTGMGY